MKQRLLPTGIKWVKQSIFKRKSFKKTFRAMRRPFLNCVIALFELRKTWKMKVMTQRKMSRVYSKSHQWPSANEWRSQAMSRYGLNELIFIAFLIIAFVRTCWSMRRKFEAFFRKMMSSSRCFKMPPSMMGTPLRIAIYSFNFVFSNNSYTLWYEEVIHNNSIISTISFTSFHNIKLW